MPLSSAAGDVNAHYLQRLNEVADQREVRANRDIYAESGMKLLAAGARVDRSTSDRLLMHKLRQPLEQSLKIGDAVDARTLSQLADQVRQQTPTLARLLASSDLVERFAAFGFSDTVRGVLTVMHGADGKSLQHAILTGLLATGLAQRLQLDKEAITALAWAGLLHDAGELYLSPHYQQPGYALKLADWRQLSAHPVIGYRLAKSVCGFSEAAATAIFVHHERYNGHGYPGGIRLQSMTGEVLAVAEVITSLSARDHPLQRAEVALKLVPGEFSPALMTSVSMALNEVKDDSIPISLELTLADIAAVQARLREAELLFKACEDVPGLHAGDQVEKLYLRSRARLLSLVQAMSSTGLGSINTDAAWHDTPQWLRFEMGLILNEIRWRLRALARDIAMRAHLLPDLAGDALAPVVQALDRP
ncbi:hypothetical protein JCM19000A_10130 [Silvimonas sp. JCM 19000]